MILSNGSAKAWLKKHFSNQISLRDYFAMRTLSFSVLLTLFASAVIGWDPSQTDCSKLPLCLTSFKWCDPDGAGCYIPDGAYAPGAIAKQALWVLLTEDYNFTISWKVLTANKDIPVRVQWWLGDDGVYWEMSMKSYHVVDAV